MKKIKAIIQSIAKATTEEEKQELFTKAMAEVQTKFGEETDDFIEIMLSIDAEIYDELSEVQSRNKALKP